MLAFGKGSLETYLGRNRSLHETVAVWSAPACIARDLFIAMSSATPPPIPPAPAAGGGNPAPQPGRPRLGQELGRGAEGVVYENPDQPGWVVKEFKPGTVSPVQAQNEFDNLERARAIRPDNVVKAQPPAGPRQGWLAKEQVLPTNVPEDLAQRAQVERDFKSIQDVQGNLMWGATADNPIPRWILIE